MCGILAVIGNKLPFSQAVANKALDTMTHRGPDDRGVWHVDGAWLGHRRLSIIDTSAAGHQPMVDEATGVALSFNGEIYNYIELRTELQALGQIFHSQSDTEVLLRAYLVWGEQCVQRFNGDWAFLIWDPRTRQAFFSRDRFAVKPLYMTRARGVLTIASEPKALLCLYPELRKVNERALFRFLKESALYDCSDCFYEGVDCLLPSRSGIYKPDEDALEITRYWDWPSEDAPIEGDTQMQFDELFEDAVKLRMRSDVPVGITLSGGLDSTAVLSVAEKQLGQHTSRMFAFTSAYEQTVDGREVDEIKWAKLAVAQCSQIDLQTIKAFRVEWIRSLRKILKSMDGPGYSPAVFPLWCIMRKATNQGVPVVLEGQGADELLGGYPDYAAAAFTQNAWRLLIQLKWHTFWRELNGYFSTFGVSFFLMRLLRLTSPSIRNLNYRFSGVLGVMRQDFVERASANREHNSPVIKGSTNSSAEYEMRQDFSSRILPGLLQYGDAVSMSQSVESRLPFLDYRLVEFCARLPIEWKIRGGETKYILREYLRRIGQLEIANRKDKKGYPTSIGALFKDNNGQLLRDLLLAPKARIIAYCDQNKISQLIDKYLVGTKRCEMPLYRLLSAELWLQECMFLESTETA